MSEISPLLPRAAQYARPSTMDKVTMLFKLLPLPIIIIWTFLFKSSRTKSKKRLVVDRGLRYVLTSFNIRQLQQLSGTTRGIYNSWCKQSKQEPIVDEIGENAKLLWIGERGFDKVIIWFHGGGYLLPPGVFALKFLNHIRTVLRERGINVSVVLLEYSLVPVGVFPTQLKQAVTAINHLMNLGVDPQNMQLIGDSAGGNLILQILGHLLHPLEAQLVPPLSIPAPFKGAYLMSPWVDLSDTFGTLSSGDPTDFLSAATLKYWGSAVTGPVPAKHLDYVEPNSAKEDWWKGVDAFVDRVLITAGQEECLKNEIIRFQSVFDNFHSHVKLDISDGIHNDPMVGCAVGEKGGDTTNLIIDWFTVGFQEATA